MSTLPTPPEISGLSWRPLHTDDAPALAELSAACASVDGEGNLITLPQYRTKLQRPAGVLEKDGLVAVDEAGRFAAYGLITYGKVTHEHRYYLEGGIRPEYRWQGLGKFLIEWMEAAARQHLVGFNDDLPKILRLDFYDITHAAKDLYERLGFEFGFAEDTMQHDVRGLILNRPLPPNMTYTHWTPQTAELFFEVYNDAFSDRPGFPGWTEPVWRAAMTEHAAFRPDLSLLLLEGTYPVGFLLSHVEPGQNQEGWIIQMGVRMAYRNRGLGSAMLCEIMRRFRQLHITYALLDVNVNNRIAQSVYRRMGFRITKRHYSYQKRVE
jgi:ribosomal protein S18 acetylase RimI-like enzyme